MRKSPAYKQSPLCKSLSFPTPGCLCSFVCSLHTPLHSKSIGLLLYAGNVSFLFDDGYMNFDPCNIAVITVISPGLLRDNTLCVFAIATGLPSHTSQKYTRLFWLIQWPPQDNDIFDVGALGEKGKCNVHYILTNDKDGRLSLVQSKGNVTRIDCHSQGYLRPVQEGGQWW